MNKAPDAPIIPETAVTELLLAIGQLVRRLRMEANPGELTWSQIATLARLDKAGWMTTADLARAELNLSRWAPRSPTWSRRDWSSAARIEVGLAL